MTLTISEDVSADEATFVQNRLVDYADQFTGPRNYTTLNLVLRGGQGEVEGGLLANTAWDWLMIGSLWVTDTRRGQGHGAALLHRAEAMAIERGCRFARLNTFEFEARAFYEREGYEVFHALEGFPEGHTQFSLRKRLTFAP